MKIIPSRTEWKHWKLVYKASYLGAWFGGLALLLTVALLFVPRLKNKDSGVMEFEQLLHQVDEGVQKPFQNWLHATTPGSPNCDEGSRILTHALQLADKLAAFKTSFPGSFRATQVMAKHEYLAMLNSFAAAIADTCTNLSPDMKTSVIYPANRVLAEYDTVTAMRRELFAQQTQDPNLARLRDIAQDIENITTWYAGRAACILFLRGYHDFQHAFKLAELSYDLYPNEPDPWMDRVRKLGKNIVPESSKQKEVTK